MREDLISSFRKLQTIISTFSFFIIIIFFITTAGLNIKEIQMSEWGTLKNVGWIFNLSLVVLSVTIFINSFLYIRNNKRIIYKRLLQFLFGSVSLSLLLVGIFDVESSNITHNIFARSYFFLYPISIFMLSHLNRKSITYRTWMSHLIYSILMIIFPLFLLMIFNGMAIAEIMHTIIVMSWNIFILKRKKI
jgi:hypothetical membrane protein